MLETYLKDRGGSLGGNQLKPIITSKSTASGISTEVQRFSTNPAFYSRVQLIVGAVGAGKSLFIRRFYRKLMSQEVATRTRWAFIDFNVMPPGGEGLADWIADRFIESFSSMNGIDVDGLEALEKIFSTEIRKFERGPAKLLKDSDPTEFMRRRTSLIEELVRNRVKFAECISRHFSGEKGLGIVIVFDNVDKRSREQQLAIFEAAQWFKDLTRALILINLRDSTFEAHRDEPPLDAFINSINFYIRPPRFAPVIRKRLELVLETLPTEVAKQQEYSLSSGYKIKYPATRLGEFLMGIYLSLFDRRTDHVSTALEALIAKDVRRALGMFGDIIVSPHIPTNQITGALLTAGENRIQEYRIIRALMRGRHKYYNGRSIYLRNILNADTDHNRPSNLLYPDILEYLIRSRKSKIDFKQEGYVTIGTLVKKMGQLGYDEQDSFRATETLVDWGLIEPESLVIENLTQDDAVRVHASGFIHMRFFLARQEYLVGVTTDLRLSSKDAAEGIGAIWSGQDHLPDLTMPSQRRILEMLLKYFEFEYGRRCRRHAFYEEHAFGGRAVVDAIRGALEHLISFAPPPRRRLG